MAWLRKLQNTPGGAEGGLAWHTPDDVVEVEDDLATALLAIPGAGFLSVPAPTAAPVPEKEPEEQAEDVDSKPAKKTAASKTAAAKVQVQE